MAHDTTTGRIWAEAGNGLSVWDVAAVLRLASGDVATLCNSSRVNPWSRFKPVRHASPSVPEIRERKAHEMELIRFFCYFENTNALIDYCEYLAHRDVRSLQGLAEKGSRDADRFMKLYESRMNSQEEIQPFITKMGKSQFSACWLYIIASIIRRIFDAVLVDLGKLT